MDQKFLDNEREYLSRVNKVLDDSLADVDKQKERLGVDLVAARKEIWDNVGDMDEYEQVGRENQAELGGDRYVMLTKLHDRLERQKDAPYFGKLDFSLGDGARINLYLGLAQVSDQAGNTFVVDWRAPVADLYYDHTLGEASYQAPKGTIKCNVHNKYQFVIKGGQLQYAVDTSTTVLDEVLLKELSKNATPVMRNIVSTIQAEQNKLIRASFGEDLLVQGVAGSGKTSIALHRIAYILYHSRSIIKPKEIWIVTPNKAFTAYIGNVLPELGEEMVPQCSMEELAGVELRKICTFETREAHLEKLYATRPAPEREGSMRYKASAQFADDIAAFAAKADRFSFHPRDFVAGDYVCPKGVLEVLYYRRFAHYPAAKRMELIAEYVERDFKEHFRAKISPTLHLKIQELVMGMYTRYDLVSLYRRMLKELQDKGAPVILPERQTPTDKGFAGDPIPYEDVYGLMLLGALVEGSRLRKHKIKHLVVDEMQDYTPVQYAYLKEVFPCPKTVLGDMGQMVDPYLNAGDLATIQRYLGVGCRVEYLPTSYRSSYEITTFANRFAEREIRPIDRHGEEPLVQKVAPDEEIAEIEKQIAYAYDKGLESVAVICRDQATARRIHHALHTKALLLLDGNTAYGGGTVVTTAFHVKGFEFDQVILPQADEDHYSGEWGKQLLYISTTRALHRLVLLCVA